MKRTVTVLLLLSLVPIWPSFYNFANDLSYYASAAAFNHNFNEVIPGRFYRSGDIPHPKLKKILREHEIKTVINLQMNDQERDENNFTEQQVVEELGAQYVHVALSSKGVSSFQRLDSILQTFDNAEKPLLVHCTSGTHRTGLASMIWMLEQEGASLERALEELTLRQGYFLPERWIIAQKQDNLIMDEMIWAFAKAHRSTGIGFRNWLNQLRPQIAYSNVERTPKN